MWRAYLATLGETPQTTNRQLSSWHFSDNEADANALAELVKQGVKRATSPSLWYFEATGQPLPKANDLHVVTDWSGRAQCIIRTSAVEIIPFDDVSAEYAALEGEGGGSLQYWRDVHWSYYHRELAGTGRVPQLNMPIICERFDVVFP
jgi:uncharacterized protein YhfF